MQGRHTARSQVLPPGGDAVIDESAGAELELERQAAPGAAQIRGDGRGQLRLEEGARALRGPVQDLDHAGLVETIDGEPRPRPWLQRCRKLETIEVREGRP